MISTATLVTVLALVVQGVRAQCPAIAFQTTYGATTSVTVSAATRATVTNPAGAPQDITILSCAEATVGPSATVSINGGVATLSGTYIPADNTISRAIAHIIGSATIPVATLASFSVYASQTLSLTAASNVVIAGDASASLSVSGELLYVDAQGGSNTVNMVSQGGSLSIGGEGSEADLTFIGSGSGDFDVFGSELASVNLRGDNYRAILYGSAVAQVFGSAVVCMAVETGTCIGRASYQTLVAGGADGFVEATTGSLNFVDVSMMGTGRVGGSQNTGVVSSGGHLEVVSTGRATVLPGAEATIFPSVSEVIVSAAGTATMYAAATVTAAPGAFLRTISGPIEIRSIGDSGTNTVFEARMLPTGGGDPDRRRALRAQPTGVCGTGLSWCPNLRGVLGCVDTQINIFNCGGCALTSGAGQDCTQVYDGAVSCIRGVCVEL